MASESPGVFHRSVHGGKWLFLTTIVQKLFNVGTFFILARLLHPEDYGVMAVVFMVTGFFDVISTPGFEKALIHRQGEIDQYLDSIWTFKILRSVCICLIIFFGAGPIAHFFHSEESVSAIRFGALFVFILGFTNSREFYFIRNLDFRKMFFRDITTQIAYLLVAIGWAMWVDASVWALLAGHLARHISGVMMSFVLYPKMPHISFRFGKLRSLWEYSRWVVGQNILGYLFGIIDSVYVGRFLDPSRLGLYSKARDLAYAPVSPFINAIVRVGFPAYSKIQDEREKLQEGFVRSFEVILAVTVPICLLLIAEGGPIVQMLLGQQWLGLVVPLKILAIATVFSTIAATIEPIFDAVGRPDINVRLKIGRLVSSLLFIYIGVMWSGLLGVAWATVLIALLNLLYAGWHVGPLLRLRAASFWPSLLPVFLAAGITIAAALPVYGYGFHYSETLPNVLFWVSVFGAVYLASLSLIGSLFHRGPMKTFASILKEVFRRG